MPLKDADSGEPPTKIKKLAIQEERDEDKYDLHTSIKCWACDPQNGKEVPEAASDAKVSALSSAPSLIAHRHTLQAQSLTTATLASLSSARQSEVKAWEEEFEACLHTITLLQDAAPPGGYAIAASGTHHFLPSLNVNLSNSEPQTRTALNATSRKTSGSVSHVAPWVVVVNSLVGSAGMDMD